MSLTFLENLNVTMTACAQVTITVPGPDGAPTNITYMPPAGQAAMPPTVWPVTPVTPGSLQLLNAARVSTDLIDALTFAANVQGDLAVVHNVTIMDAVLLLNATFDAPVFTIPSDGAGYMSISAGVLNITCLTPGPGLGKPVLVFTFANVEATANVSLAQSNGQIGLYPQIIALNSSSFSFKLVAPKVPWSKSAERPILEHVMGHMTSVINKFEKHHVFWLPKQWTPFLVNPSITMVNQPPGDKGYLDIVSYCRCASASSTTAAATDPQASGSCTPRWPADVAWPRALRGRSALGDASASPADEWLPCQFTC